MFLFRNKEDKSKPPPVPFKGKDVFFTSEDLELLKNGKMPLRNEDVMMRDIQSLAESLKQELDLSYCNHIPESEGKQSLAFKGRLKNGENVFIKSAPSYNLADIEKGFANLRGVEPSDVTSLEYTHQLKRGALVHTIWHNAKESGKLEIPEGSLLKLPKVINQGERYVVFEDLVSQGYSPCSMDTIYTREEAIAIADALADLHISLWKIHDEFQGITSHSIEPLDYEAIKSSLDSVANCPIKLKNFVSKEQDYINSLHSMDVPLILCHGDPIVQNIMLQKVNNEIKGVAFVDFAGLEKGNPWFDFCGFYHTGVDVAQIVDYFGACKEIYSTKMRECGYFDKLLFTNAALCNGFTQCITLFEPTIWTNQYRFRRLINTLRFMGVVYARWQEHRDSEKETSIEDKKDTIRRRKTSKNN